MQLITQNESDRSTPEGNTSTNAPSKLDGLEVFSPREGPLLENSEDSLVLIAVMGVTGSGKTTFVNQASKSGLEVGEDLNSCTSEIQESEEFILDGRRVLLIDTPGFDDTHVSDTDVLKSIAAFLGESYSAGAKLAGVIYVHRISDVKFGGLAARNFRMFRELCGEKTLENVVVVTNMWGKVTLQQGDAREQQLKDEHFKAAIEKGAQLCRHDDTPESAHAILREIIKNQPVVLQIQRELIDEGKNIEETGAGAELTREIHEVVEKYQREIRELKDSMQSVVGMDEEYRKELEEEKRRMGEEMEKLRKDSEGLRSDFEAARRDMEERINARFEAQAARVQEGYAAKIKEYENKLAELECSKGDNISEIEDLKESLGELYQEVRRIAQKEARRCIIM